MKLALATCVTITRHVTFVALESQSESEVAQSCPTLCDPMDCSLPDSSICGIFQARVLEWAAISFSRGSSRPRDRTQVPQIVGQCFTIWATREVPGVPEEKENSVRLKKKKINERMAKNSQIWQNTQ